MTGHETIPREQSWPTKYGDVIYRVTLRDMKSGANIGVIRDLVEANCMLPEEWLKYLYAPAIRVEVKSSQGKEEWSTWIPFCRIDTPDNNVADWIKRPN